jgi:tetratricopeptide (TPR) repeat protein
MKYDLFISYSRADYWDKNECVIPGNIVSQIVETLEAYQQHYKFEYFFDQEAIESRAAYLKRIASAIDESKVMLFVASKSSYSSEFCPKELNFADKREIPIFQYCIDDAKIPLDIELLLGTHQFRSSKHYSVEKIVQDALSEALGFKVKPLSELTHVQPHITDGHTPKFKRVANLSIKTIVGVVVSAILLFSALFVFEVIFRDTEPIIPPLIDKNITPIEIDDSLTAEQLFSKGKEYFNKKDYNSAVQYYYKSAHMGYSKAQNNLGTCYENGHGVTKSVAEAVKWYRKAVEQGNKTAKENLRTLGYQE